MNNSLLLFSSIFILIITFIIQRQFYRISGFMVSFVLFTLFITKDITSIFIIMVNGFIIYLLLLLSYKEYPKNDN
ncbi:MAG: hypothetical protein NTY22_03580 [Proteobacteria bacterium]|nr:hypothetical protein [Pseudomonadota bacterium]